MGHSTYRPASHRLIFSTTHGPTWSQKGCTKENSKNSAPRRSKYRSISVINWINTMRVSSIVSINLTVHKKTQNTVDCNEEYSLSFVHYQSFYPVQFYRFVFLFPQSINQLHAITTNWNIIVKKRSKNEEWRKWTNDNRRRRDSKIWIFSFY